MARRRFFVDAVLAGRASISGVNAHHLTRVLRVEPGQQYEISDNQSVYLAEVESVRKDLVSFSVGEKLVTAQIPVFTTILASLIRFERFEWMLEKATELGVHRVIPVQADRSEKGLEQAAGKRLSRWNRIVREASEQSRRDRMPEISGPIPFPAALAIDATHRYVLEELKAPAILSALPVQRQHGNSIALLVGPEGGWTDHERVSIASAGWRSVSLGRQILRAETAAIAALAIVNAAWSPDGEQLAQVS